MKRLTKSECHREYPADLARFMIALLRLRIRRGPKQLKLLMGSK